MLHDAKGLLSVSIPTVVLPSVLTSLIEPSMPSAPIEVSNPSMTDSVVFATIVQEPTMASTSLEKTSSGNFLEITDNAAGSSAVPSSVLMAAATVVTPFSAPSSSPGFQAIATF